MMDNEPLVFPTRNSLRFDPAIPNRQVWAVGMIVVQWAALEVFIDTHIRKLVGGDKQVMEICGRIRGFQQLSDFWREQIEMKTADPERSRLLEMVMRAKNYSSQRDDVVHRLWGGGMDETSSAASGLPSHDGALMAKSGEQFKSSAKPGQMPFKWRASFQRLRQLAREIAALNRDLMFTLSPPHGEDQIDRVNRESRRRPSF
jgi:hypothetical protein